MSMNSDQSRPDIDEAPPKSVSWNMFLAFILSVSRRMRSDARVEDKARSKRLFGNLLGTLQKFKKEDRSSRTSEAVRLENKPVPLICG